MVTQQIISVGAIKGEIWGLTGGMGEGGQISSIAEFVRDNEVNLLIL
ncbi:Uncharacterised protein [Serratia fonticola]|uniref:Uncharacterized protein n=1 Tax=Serratia fonticola TaxID=47917 RepID=A0A4U9W346_SERFO|nr:Uncharacterised protein [Serratia fonticola]